MKLYFLIISICLPAFFQQAKAIVWQEFDKVEYYRILKSGSVDEINKEIETVENSSLSGKEAFAGTLLMKKSGLLEKAKDKLSFFKTGRIKLETEINNDNANVEYHFLRLIIEEHAPKVVKYRMNIDDDAALIKKNFKELSSDVQKIVVDYSQNSTALKPEDFQP